MLMCHIPLRSRSKKRSDLAEHTVAGVDDLDEFKYEHEPPEGRKLLWFGFLVVPLRVDPVLSTVGHFLHVANHLFVGFLVHEVGHPGFFLEIIFFIVSGIIFQLAVFSSSIPNIIGFYLFLLIGIFSSLSLHIVGMVVEIARLSLSLTGLFTDNVGIHFALARKYLSPRVLHAEVVLTNADCSNLH